VIPTKIKVQFKNFCFLFEPLAKIKYFPNQPEKPETLAREIPILAAPKYSV